MRENEKEQEELKASRPKFFLLKRKRSPYYNDGWDLYTVPQPRKIIKELELITIT